MSDVKAVSLELESSGSKRSRGGFKEASYELSEAHRVAGRVSSEYHEIVEHADTLAWTPHVPCFPCRAGSHMAHSHTPRTFHTRWLHC